MGQKEATQFRTLGKLENSFQEVLLSIAAAVPLQREQLFQIEDNFQGALLTNKAAPPSGKKLLQQEANFQDALLTAPAITQQLPITVGELFHEEEGFQDALYPGRGRLPAFSSRRAAIEAELFYLYNLNSGERERIQALERELSDIYNYGDILYDV